MRGSECTGTVLEVGDEVKHLVVGDPVIALSDDSFSTNVVTKGHMATLLPECLGFTDGAGVPITFLTVDYALNQAARLQAGERILIHAGAGGIGGAAGIAGTGGRATRWAASRAARPRSFLRRSSTVRATLSWPSTSSSPFCG